MQFEAHLVFARAILSTLDGRPGHMGASDFVERHPTVKMLPLSFLLMIGVMLIGEGLDHQIPKGYVYFSMAFSVFVEVLNIRLHRKAAQPVHFHQPYAPPSGESVRR